VTTSSGPHLAQIRVNTENRLATERILLFEAVAYLQSTSEMSCVGGDEVTSPCVWFQVRDARRLDLSLSATSWIYHRNAASTGLLAVGTVRIYNMSRSVA
jgi:hypothetical protein